MKTFTTKKCQVTRLAAPAQLQYNTDRTKTNTQRTLDTPTFMLFLKKPSAVLL